MHPPRVRDGWHLVDIVELFGKRYQVVMRNHRTTRRKSFHPVHQGAPGNLMGRRLTVIYGGGGRSEVADNWSETWETSGWTGYTLFLQRIVEGPHRPESKSQNSALHLSLRRRSWMRMLMRVKMKVLSWWMMMRVLELCKCHMTGTNQNIMVVTAALARDFEPCLSSQTAMGAMGSLLASASTRLAVDEEELGQKKKVLQRDPRHKAADGGERDGRPEADEEPPERRRRTDSAGEPEGERTPQLPMPATRPEPSRSPIGAEVMDEVVRGGPSSSTTSPPTKARPTTRTMQTTSTRAAMSSSDLVRHLPSSRCLRKAQTKGCPGQ